MNTPEDAVSAPPEPAVLERLRRDEIWRQISEAALSDQEQLVLGETLIYALPPRAIQARHPDLFTDVAEIYRIKLGLFQRLRQHHRLQQLYLKALAR
jgi:hypothetical protein